MIYIPQNGLLAFLCDPGGEEELQSGEHMKNRAHKETSIFQKFKLTRKTFNYLALEHGNCTMDHVLSIYNGNLLFGILTN